MLRLFESIAGGGPSLDKDGHEAASALPAWCDLRT